MVIFHGSVGMSVDVLQLNIQTGNDCVEPMVLSTSKTAPEKDKNHGIFVICHDISPCKYRFRLPVTRASTAGCFCQDALLYHLPTGSPKDMRSMAGPTTAKDRRSTHLLGVSLLSLGLSRKGWTQHSPYWISGWTNSWNIQKNDETGGTSTM